MTIASSQPLDCGGQWFEANLMRFTSSQIAIGAYLYLNHLASACLGNLH
ncbi:hypothetical protein [Chamaesiphon sp. GL140_3_metabinner_50]|nr:hypothetical protein [Chamaesiphon sp. GL140_3_metabinner_50]